MFQEHNKIPISSVLSALGTLIGYIGTEVASDSFFHRVLWPQRAYNNVRPWNMWKLALFLPIGSPLHKAALQTMDTFFENRLFQAPIWDICWGLHSSQMAIRALSQMPGLVEAQHKPLHPEDCKHEGKIRQRVTVSHLVLSSGQADGEDISPLVEGDIGAVTWGPIAGILASEATAILTAIAVAILIEGPEFIVMPFFRHYGHPQRCRWRKIAQVAIIRGLGIIFPVRLIYSSLWIPLGLQALWTGYALYATTALYISRYAYGCTWATTEERLAEVFSIAEKKGETPRVRFQAERGSIVTAELVRTTHDNFHGAKRHVQELIRQEVKSS
ncbi:hypothetical protein MGYG_00325 [Nannizzia gypsea CBS 118893]|uniref:Uncharacterized protein n=1 Tax=Arthroderma gypseum (strain ATCC MYA-4604 / CBS 118893) TaxID=535722 RepID=E5QYU6_ARTGP|nr:hypothetical protein MGYG_00325 [Nannizzia gypsea CBS 118893]EFQ97284.1 hypothetical protein MGYG_00325 [Nannizzia gypsea CBS 118893]